MDSVIATPVELNDDQIEDFIADPAKIPDHQTALALLDFLDGEIGHIQAQLDQANADKEANQLTDAREDWLRRATYACAMFRCDRHKVYQRDKEIRGTKGAAIHKPKRDPGEGLAKQERLKVEAETRKVVAATKKQMLLVQQMEIAQKISERKERMHHSTMFREAARSILSAEQFAAIESAVST